MLLKYSTKTFPYGNVMHIQTSIQDLCCHINIANVCHLGTNTITNKEIKANIKAISFW